MLKPIHICQQCKPHRQRPCVGACPCLLDGRDIIAHAKANYCPDKRYGDGIEPANWSSVPRVIGKSPAEIEAELERQGLTIDGAKRTARAGSCCDPPKE